MVHSGLSHVAAQEFPWGSQPGASVLPPRPMPHLQPHLQGSISWLPGLPPIMAAGLYERALEKAKVKTGGP